MIWLMLYLVFLFVFSLHSVCFNSSETDYYVCGRKAGTAMVALSILASCIGGSATVGMTGLAWQVGTPAFWWLGAGACGLFILGCFLARKVRESGAITMPEIVRENFGGGCGYLASIIILLAWLAILAAQFSALGVIIASLTGLNGNYALLAGAFILFAYTFLGGQLAVMKSDVWQFMILALSLLLALAFMLLNPDARNALQSVEPEIVNSDFSWSRLRYFLCILGGSYVVCPMLFGRLLSARDASCARSGVFWAVAGLILAACLVTALGIACRGLVAADTAPEDVLGAVINQHMPDWAGKLILLGLFSAIISSADSCLMTASSVFANDIARRKNISVCRAYMVIMSVAACVLAMRGKGILALLLMANDIYVCGIVPPVFLGMLFGNGRAANRPMLFAAMLGGGILGLVSAITANDDWSFAGIAFSSAFSLLAVTISRGYECYRHKSYRC